jgi:hypothetical protein
MLTRVRHWLKKPSPFGGKRLFSLTCDCGRSISGPRLETPQVVACPGCGLKKFILPTGPWLELAESLYPEKPAPPEHAFAWRALLLPGMAALLALAVLVYAYEIWIKPVFFSGGADSALSSLGPQAKWRDKLARAHKYLSEGSFRLALEELPQEVEELTGPERRDWQQTSKQAALLADLLPEPLEDILRHGAGVREQEWQADFRHRYQGKSFILDAEFRRTGEGGWEVLYPLYQGRDPARIVVADLQLLKLLPEMATQRLVVGMRLAGVRLEPPGPGWVVRVQPDSGVFLTDAAAAALVCPAWGQPDALAILERQRHWLKP